jgi:hypothetical protein
VRATSSDGSTSLMTIALQVVNLNDNAPALNLQSITVLQGENTLLSPAVIAAADPDGALSPLTFAVGNIAAGHFESLAAPGVAVTTFSEADLAAGRVQFVHDGSNVTPAFDISVSDGLFTTGPVSAPIRFSLLRVAPVDPTLPVTPSGPGSPVGTGTSSETPGGTSGTTSSTGTAARAPELPARVPASLQDALLAGALDNRTLAPLAVAERTEGIEVQVNNPNVVNNLVPVRINFLEEFKLQLSRLATADSGQGTHGTHFEAPKGLADSDNRPYEFAVGLDAARMAGLAFSVGAVWWALRAGGLMASLLASTPAWRQLDPLPILRDKEQRQDKGRWLEEDVAVGVHVDEQMTSTRAEAGSLQ